MTDWRDRLRKAIDDSDLSLPEIAVRADYDYVTLWKVLKKNKHVMKRSSMRRVCNVLNVDPEYIWHGYTIDSESTWPESKNIPLLTCNQLTDWFERKINKSSVERLILVMTDHPNSFAIRNQFIDIKESIPQDAIVILDQDREPEQGDFVLVRYQDSYILRQYFISIGETYLKPTCDEFKTVMLGQDDEVKATVTSYISMVVDEPEMYLHPPLVHHQK